MNDVVGHSNMLGVTWLELLSITLGGPNGGAEGHNSILCDYMMGLKAIKLRRVTTWIGDWRIVTCCNAITNEFLGCHTDVVGDSWRYVKVHET